MSRFRDLLIAHKSYWPTSTPAAIKSACVLWYDIQRQGATNENMAINPILKDLSGNGHNATCYNFDWAGMSGIGGYGLSFSQYSNIQQDRAVIEFDGDYITIIKSIVSATWQLYNRVSNQLTVPAQRIKVTNVPQNVSVNYCYRDATGISIIHVSITKDGIYDLPSFTVPSGQIYGFEIQRVIDECNIIIEQLPQYPNALVSDGVDDYCYVAGLPLLTKEKGFTVIAKRKWIGDPRSKSQGFVSKGSNFGWVDGAFYFEGVEGGGTAFFNRVFDNPDSKSGVNYILEENFTQGDITYLTSTRYNDSEIKNIGDGIDTDKLVIFRLGTTINNCYSSIAIYSLLLFNRDLTDEEIEWVKNNLIE